MAAIPVTLNGVFTTDTGSVTGVFQGTMAYSGLGVGGGPIIPDKPGGIWGGGNVPMPTPPIANVPGAPGYRPPTDAHPEHPIVIPPEIWPNPPEGTAPHPEHPIVIPPPPELPNAPPLQAKVVWVPPGYPNSGWNVIYVPTGEHPAPG